MGEAIERSYEQRCVMCRHCFIQNELIGDCRVFDKDVYLHSVEPCDSYEAKP